ncbi:hypothetical protein HORIV_59300 [Vreelandella olivaria]|uniref:Uncharacterized protein n=1 Tax=Vreelandella olivaria TaxID=390919 RepID=A0ABN5X2N3_9GAMM|nr:hypothetical protein HORIV_59300 [Halomonas olivaria]
MVAGALRHLLESALSAMVKGMILFALTLMTLQAALHLWQSLKAKPRTGIEEAR